MVCSRAQEPPSSGQEERPQLLWLAELTGAHIGLAPIPQDAQDRCSIWENLVSLVDFQCPGFPLTSEELCGYIDIPRTPSSSSSSSSSSSAGSVTATLPQDASWPPGLAEDVDYKTNGELKPPYSYSTLIRMAMEASEEPKLTLAAICEWIRDNFCYFRRAHPGWQSSIRHNLCINKRFVKVPREKGEPGRGAFWKLHPRYAQRLKDGTRTLPDLSIPPASSRRTQHGARHVPSPAASACGLEVGAELQRLLREFEEFESSQGRDPTGQRGSAGPGWDLTGQRGSAGPGWDPAGPGSQGRDPAGQRGSAGPGRDPAGQRGSAGPGWDPAGQRGSAGPGSPGRDPAGPGSPEEPGALTELMSDADWEALLDLSPEQGDFCALEQLSLSPSSLPGEFSPLPEREAEQRQGWAQGQQRGLAERGPAEPGLDETLLATAFLEAAWPQEPAENGPGSGPAENGPGPGPAENGPGSGPAENGPGPGSGPAENGPGSGPAENGPGPGSGPAENGPGSGPAENGPGSGPAESGPGSGSGPAGRGAADCPGSAPGAGLTGWGSLRALDLC